jgi:primosomal protein N' (replication factor Y) (superfamily II helicase)
MPARMRRNTSARNPRLKTMPHIAKIVVDLPVAGPFDYHIPKNLQADIKVGSRVYVPFHTRYRIGCVVGFKAKSSFRRLKPVLATLDAQPIFSEETMKFTKEFAESYGCSWGEAMMMTLPKALRKKKATSLTLGGAPKAMAQKAAEMIFCQGVSGEQSWSLIIRRITETLNNDQGVIVLVPEVAMMTGVGQVLEQNFPKAICLLGKETSEREELERWQLIREGKTRLVLGTRSAIFAPVMNLGLLVICEEENPAFKQEQTPFYHVRDVALMRRKIEKAAILFVSAAPTAELWSLLQKAKIKAEIFAENNLVPLQVIDMTNYKLREKTAISVPLQNALTETLVRGGRSLLLLNRRGFGTITHCSNCGFVMTCEKCGVNLTFLFSRKQLTCRLCNAEREIPSICPSCTKSYLRSEGVGIEKMESELSRIFPQAQVVRFDRESRDIPKQANIVIATQAVKRLRDQLAFDMIGVLDFDAQLNRSDFRSTQQAFSWLIQFRQMAREKVFVQTRLPDNYCLQTAIGPDFQRFYDTELKFRRELGFPPFRHLINIGVRGPKEELVFEQAQVLFERLQQAKINEVDFAEPQADTPAKLRGKYRFVIVLKGKSVKQTLRSIQPVLSSSPRKSGMVITVHVDP